MKQSSPGSSPDPQPETPNPLTQEERIVASIRQIIRAVDLHSRRLVEAHGLTGPQLAVLSEVVRAGPVAPTALARAVHLSQATVTGIIQRLERSGLVQRDANAVDRRSVLLHATDAGRRLLAASPSPLQDRFRAALAELDEDERDRILETLQRVAGLMGARDLDASPHLTPGEIDPAPRASESASRPASVPSSASRQ